MRKFFLLAVIAVLYFTSFATGHYNGIDISHHNHVNWKLIADHPDIEFCYIKATEGANWVDSKCKEYVKEANKIKLHVGLYHYYRTGVPAKSQLQNFKRMYDSLETDLIPAIDVEDTGNNFDDRAKVKEELNELIDLFRKEYSTEPLVYVGSLDALWVCGLQGKRWVRCIGFSHLVPNTIVKQTGEEEIDGVQIDINYCKDVNQLIIKNQKKK